MSREHKYRAYIPETGKLEYFDISNITVPDRMLSQHSYPIQQFTGLTDSKGKEIYEGDFIRGMFDYGPAGFIEQTLPIKWNNIKGYQWEYWDLSTIEVIGNIFENKELLK